MQMLAHTGLQCKNPMSCSICVVKAIHQISTLQFLSRDSSYRIFMYSCNLLPYRCNLINYQFSVVHV